LVISGEMSEDIVEGQILWKHGGLFHT
jgi:hypothetical protein